jgi:hypothetical protein
VCLDRESNATDDSTRSCESRARSPRLAEHLSIRPAPLPDVSSLTGRKAYRKRAVGYVRFAMRRNGVQGRRDEALTTTFQAHYSVRDSIARRKLSSIS